MTGMSISALARQGGVGVETVRYYQRRGLLQAPPRPGGVRTGVHRYFDADLRRLRFIRAAQGAGFTLEQIGELLELDANRDRSRVHLLATQRIAALEAKIEDLQRARDALSRLVRRCGGSPSAVGPCPILDAFDPQ